MRFFRLCFSWDGEVTRTQFTLGILFVYALTIPFAILAKAYTVPLNIFICTALALSVVAGTSLRIRRFHNLGRSGRWAVLAFVPVIGLLLDIFLCFRGPRDRKFRRAGPGLKRLSQAGLAVVALFIVARAFWAPFYIPSGSMKPSLLVGDYLIASMISKSVKHGDVILFWHPTQLQPFVARVIGLPGDNVGMKDGRVLLNGTLIPQAPQAPFKEPRALQGANRHMPRCMSMTESPVCTKEQFTETLPNGARYNVLNIRATRLDNTDVFEVPPGTYFALGDNRDNSIDSRIASENRGFGFVPQSNIIGRATRVLVSAAGPTTLAFWTWRPDRYWLKL
ncbi:MAG: signal peptidase I [Pseudomonadota bacterium]